MEIVLRGVRLQLEANVGPPGDDAPAGAAGELEGFWFVVTEVDDDGEPAGTVVRFPCQPAHADLLANAILGYLGDTTRAPGLELVDDELEHAPGELERAPVENRALRRARKFGSGMAAQDARAQVVPGARATR